MEEFFQSGKGLAGLDEHQVRRHTSWSRWVTLAMLAHAFPAVVRAAEHDRGPGPDELIPLTCNEIRRLFTALVVRPVRDAVTATITDPPEHLRRPLTWDQGAEMAQHAQLRIDTGLQIYFAGPHSPWQCGTDENTNGLLRQYFPKGTGFSRHARGDLDAVAAALDGRPRKTLERRTPAEVLNEQLLVIPQNDGVATTG